MDDDTGQLLRALQPGSLVWLAAVESQRLARVFALRVEVEDPVSVIDVCLL